MDERGEGELGKKKKEKKNVSKRKLVPRKPKPRHVSRSWLETCRARSSRDVTDHVHRRDVSFDARLKCAWKTFLVLCVA